MDVRVPESGGDGAVGAFENIGVLRDGESFAAATMRPERTRTVAWSMALGIGGDVDADVADGEVCVGEGEWRVGVVERPDDEEVRGDDHQRDRNLQTEEKAHQFKDSW